MNIAATQYTLLYGSLEVYVSGCDGPCKGCHNPELKDFNVGNPYQDELHRIKQKLKDFDSMISAIWILGGEPLCQDTAELIDLISELKTSGKRIVLFTRFELEDVPPEVARLCDYIKTGKYKEELKVDNYYRHGIKLATSNQDVHRMENGHEVKS